MKLFDSEGSTDLVDDTPTFDKTEMNERFKEFKL